ncbi:MAG: DotI/IcmL/TraM family protein [Candidatus Competibacteraceae bacterium]|nr:DotI/IcmL/TraM family protein [Candidatus Competibacteraceae bacterium]
MKKLGWKTSSDEALSGVAVAVENDALVATRVRYEWYRDGFRILLALLLFLGFSQTVSLGLIVYLYTYQPSPKFLVQTADHQLVGVVPLDQPSFSDLRITQWATDAVLAANNWNFADYRETLQKACNEYFTAKGCEEYRDALIKIGNLDAVKEKRLTVRAVVVKPPIITNKVIGEQTQRLTWRLQMEIVVSYLGTQQSTQNQIIELVVVRRPLTEYEKGVGIEKYIAKTGKS